VLAAVFPFFLKAVHHGEYEEHGEKLKAGQKYIWPRIKSQCALSLIIAKGRSNLMVKTKPKSVQGFDFEFIRIYQIVSGANTVVKCVDCVSQCPPCPPESAASGWWTLFLLWREHAI